MYNGFTYLIIDKLIVFFKLLNLFELFKAFGRHLARKKTSDIQVQYIRIASDIYILFKWMAVLLLHISFLSGWLMTSFIWYFIFFNIFTFFYYFIWKSESLKHDIQRQKRRFVNLVQGYFSRTMLLPIYITPSIAKI